MPDRHKTRCVLRSSSDRNAQNRLEQSSMQPERVGWSGPRTQNVQKRPNKNVLPSQDLTSKDQQQKLAMQSWQDWQVFICQIQQLLERTSHLQAGMLGRQWKLPRSMQAYRVRANTEPLSWTPPPTQIFMTYTVIACFPSVTVQIGQIIDISTWIVYLSTARNPKKWRQGGSGSIWVFLKWATCFLFLFHMSILRQKQTLFRCNAD